jgi:hypothetical protein
MRKIQDGAAFFFVVCVAILTVVAVLGVWDFFNEDVISKSFQTIGILAAAAVVTIVAGRYVDARKTPASATDAMGNVVVVPVQINPAFTMMRHATIVVLIISVVLLALFGVLAIWEVLSGEVVNKSLSSIAIVAFAAFVIVITCLDREDHKLLHSPKGEKNEKSSVLRVILWIVVIVTVVPWFFRALLGGF